MERTNASTSRVATAIRDRRIEIGMSQEDLSRSTGISRSKLSGMENGRFGSVRLMMEVCDALGLELFAVSRENAGQVSLPLIAPAVSKHRRVSRTNRDSRG